MQQLSRKKRRRFFTDSVKKKYEFTKPKPVPWMVWTWTLNVTNWPSGEINYLRLVSTLPLVTNIFKGNFFALQIKYFVAKKRLRRKQELRAK